VRGNETRGRIVTNFCTDVGGPRRIISANFYNYSLRRLGVVAGVKFWASPLTCVVVLTTIIQISISTDAEYVYGYCSKCRVELIIVSQLISLKWGKA